MKDCSVHPERTGNRQDPAWMVDVSEDERLDLLRAFADNGSPEFTVLEANRLIAHRRAFQTGCCRDHMLI